MHLQSSGAEGEDSRIPHPILPVRSPCYYGVTFHRTRNPSRSIHEYNDLRCSRFFLSLSLFLFFHRIVAIRRREYLFFVGGTRRTLGDARPRVPRILSDVRSREKNIIDGRRSFREITGIRPHFPYRFIIVLLRDFSVLFARAMPRPHRYKSNFLLETAHAVHRNFQFDTGESSLFFFFFFLSYHVTLSSLSFQRGFFSPSVIETIGSSLFIPGTRDQRERERKRERGQHKLLCQARWVSSFSSYLHADVFLTPPY